MYRGGAAKGAMLQSPTELQDIADKMVAWRGTPDAAPPLHEAAFSSCATVAMAKRCGHPLAIKYCPKSCAKIATQAHVTAQGKCTRSTSP